MRLPLKIARRYIFSKKSTNAINIISGISVLGITLGSMALVVILSVFNGFELLLGGLISSFKPDVHISIEEGKVFQPDADKVARIQALPEVEYLSQTLTEVALFEYDGRQKIGYIKGVDAQFDEVTDLDSMIKTGRYELKHPQKETYFAVVGASLEYDLNVIIDDRVMGGMEPLYVYMPKRNQSSSFSPMSRPFKQRSLYPVGGYAIQQDYDNFILSDLAFVQDLLSYEKGEISALEVKLKQGAKADAVIADIQEILGLGFRVRNRYQQDEAFFQVTSLEKWVVYLILTFTLMLVAFNMVGALWMLVLEKKDDIRTLKALGADNGLIRRIFLTEGLLLSFIGLLLGFALAITLCVLQQQYGLVRLQGSGTFIVDAYPVDMRWADFVVIFFTVLGVGGLAAWIPALRAGQMQQNNKN